MRVAGKLGNKLERQENSYRGRGDCSLSIGWGSIFLGVEVHRQNSLKNVGRFLSSSLQKPSLFRSKVPPWIWTVDYDSQEYGTPTYRQTAVPSSSISVSCITNIFTSFPATLICCHDFICIAYYLLDHFHPHLQLPQLPKTFEVETHISPTSCCAFFHTRLLRVFHTLQVRIDQRKFEKLL